MAEYTDAKTWKERKEKREDELRTMFEDAQKYYDIMYAVQNTTKISPWKSKVYVPILASKAWDLIARMSDVVPRFDVTIKNEFELDDQTGNFRIPEMVKQRKKRIESKLHCDYTRGDTMPMKLKVFDPLVDAVVAGTGYAYAPWVFETRVQKARRFNQLGIMDNEHVVVKKTQTGHNGFEGINFYDVIPAKGPNFWAIPWLIVKGSKPLVDFDPDLYTNLDAVNKHFKDDQADIYNQSRNRVVNENEQLEDDETVDMVTFYECYERTANGITLTTYAEAESDDEQETGWVEIRPTTIPYWHNMFPVVPFYCRRKSYSPFGESLFENNRTLQSATNDLFNHYLDNWNLSIESMLMYEDGTLTNDFIIEPGGEITFTGEPPKQFKFPEPNPQQLSLVMGVIEKGVENATFSQYASGVPDSGSDKTQGTAYGVKTITEAATTKIGFFRDNFKQSMRVVGQIWLSNLQQFADEPEEINYTNRGQTVPDVVMPSDYQGELELDINDDSMIPTTKADRRDAHDALVNNVLGIQKAAIQQSQIFKDPTDIPRFNFQAIIEETAELYSGQDIDQFLLDNTVEIPQEPQDDTKEYLNLSYKDAPPDIKAQIEQRMGLEPSALHDTDMVTAAATAGANQAELENPGGLLNEPQPEQPAGAGSKPTA